MIKKLLYIFIFCFVASWGWAATYNYYFATTGGGSTCSEGSPCATLASAETKANSATSSDTVNLYFAQGDTWTCNTEGQSQGQECFAVNYNEATVNIDSYNNGGGSAKPIFDGQVNWATENTQSNCSGPPCRINYFFRFRSTSSISNVEIKNTYGSAIIIDSYGGGSCAGRDCADGTIVQDNDIHDIGMEAVTNNFNAGIEDCVVQRNLIYNVERINEKSLCDAAVPNCWGAALHFMTEGVGSNGIPRNNTVKYNVLYNSYGEGINNKNGITEYNIVGDTASIAIDLSPHDWNLDTTSIARYNLIIHSDRSTSIYDNFASSSQAGIRIIDETPGSGSNTADIEIYGNITINATYGLRIYCNPSCTGADDFSGDVKIYNNTFIDSATKNIYFDDEDNYDNIYFYNNASILYDQTGDRHTLSMTPGVGWDISHNSFWTNGGSPSYDSDFSTSAVTTDPDLPGEPSFNWDGQTGTYWYSVDVTTHLYPPSDSPLINAGDTLGYIDDFLTTGNDFDDVLTGNIGSLAAQSGSWDIGAVIRGDAPPAGSGDIQGIQTMQGVTIN